MKLFQLVFGFWNERVVGELVGNMVFVIIKGVFGFKDKSRGSRLYLGNNMFRVDNRFGNVIQRIGA